MLDVFAEYAKTDADARLVLLGDGKLMNSIKSKAKELSIADKILFVGNVGNANEWYSAFDLFVLPSIWEGLPVVGVEAQAADLPCIFSTAVTKEIGLSEKSVFLSLNSNVEKWVKAFKIGIENDNRKDNSELIRNNNYDIKLEAIKLQNRYLEMAGVE